jgi:hypothetical protein
MPCKYAAITPAIILSSTYLGGSPLFHLLLAAIPMRALLMLAMPAMLTETTAVVTPAGIPLIRAGGGQSVLATPAYRVYRVVIVIAHAHAHAHGGCGIGGVAQVAVAAERLEEVAHHGEGGGHYHEGGLDETPDYEGEGIICVVLDFSWVEKGGL